MTGEMGWRDLKEYTEMQKLTRMIRRYANVAAQLRPFDVYQGPYIAVNLREPASRRTLGSWQVQVWGATDRYEPMYRIEYRGKFSRPLQDSEVVDRIYRLTGEARRTRTAVRTHFRKAKGRGGKRRRC